MNKCYEIRLESIGGLGANLCSKMLGELGVKYLNYNSASFSSYGSEKTGTPVKGYIKYCPSNKEIRDHAPVEVPDLLVVFHQALLQDKSVWNGCHQKTKVLIAIEEGQGLDIDSIPSDIEKIYFLPAQKIAMETHSRINMIMLGAIAKIAELGTLEDVQNICKDTLGSKYPDALMGNLEGIRRGYEEIKEETDGEKDKRKKASDNKQVNREADNKPKWGYQNAPIGGINPCFGSTVTADVSPSRQGFIPIFIKERCINCGLCDSTCPDMVFQFRKGEYRGKEMMVNQGLDYYHCKGCLRCVEVCPVNALVQGIEAEHKEKDYFLPNQELLKAPEYYKKSGPDGYITSESFLTEKRMEGGEV